MKWVLFIFLLVICNVFAWQRVLFAHSSTSPRFYFFDVGQGDSALIHLGPVQILVDGGPPNSKALKGIERILDIEDRYIDLVILTHPHLDHFGGLPDIMDRYTIGTFITGGTTSKNAAYAHIRTPDIVLGEGDRITYGDYTLSILGPNTAERTNTDPNKTSLVFMLEGPDTRIFYAGDMHADNENRIRKEYALNADVLKVAHHGSRFSSSATFLKELQPKITIISVGNNAYGHPAPVALERITDIGAKIYDTRTRGTIKIVPQDGQLQIYTEK